MQSTKDEQLSNNVTRASSPITTTGSDAKMIPTETSSLAVIMRKELPTSTTVLGATWLPELYRKELISWNKDVVHEPAVIVQPESTADVCAAVKAAVKHGARLVIAGGRHGHDCLADDAMVIDLSRMKAVTVDAEAKLVTVEGGARLGDMDRACQPYGLAAVTGTNPDTGVVGLSTAGGGGYLSRQYGMACDNFHSAEVVLANGESVVASHTQNSDLLWALAGSGSNCGIVTKLTMRLHPVDHVFGGLVINVAPSASRAQAVLADWRDWIIDADRSVMSMAVLPCGAPVVPMAVCELSPLAVPQEAEGAPPITADSLPSLREKLGGSLTKLSRGKLPLGKCFGSIASIKQLKRMRYHTDLQPQLEAMQASGHYYDASCVVPELSEGVIATLVEFTRKRHVNSDASIIIFPLGGAIADAPTESTAFWGAGRPKDGFWIIIEGKWQPSAAEGAGRAAVVGWVKALRAALSAFNVGDTAHTLDGNMEAELSGVAAIFGPNYERVKQVKTKYDPTNVFRCNRNIAPNDS